MILSDLLTLAFVHPRTVILLAVFGVISVLALRSLRAHRLKERYVVLFLLTGVPFLILAIWPDGVVFLEKTLEIEKPTLLVLCVTIYFMLTTFALLSIVSVQERRITTLAQLVSVLIKERGHDPEQVDAMLEEGGSRDA